jgi:hypothetical protein
MKSAQYCEVFVLILTTVTSGEPEETSDSGFRLNKKGDEQGIEADWIWLRSAK